MTLIACSVLHPMLNEAESVGPETKMNVLNIHTSPLIIEPSPHLKSEC